jgi:hypothetical protein
MGIPAKDRARYEHLVESLRHVILGKRELPNGYAFRIDASRLASGQLVEWIELEKRCCPFLVSEFEGISKTDQCRFISTEAKGKIKSFILDEFGFEVALPLGPKGR